MGGELPAGSGPLGGAQSTELAKVAHEKEDARTKGEGILILRRLLAYGEKIFGLREQWGRIGDTRPRGQIETAIFPTAFFLMFLCRLPSFNELEAHRRRPIWKRWCGQKLPCADECAYVAERLQLQDLRNTLFSIHGKLRRNKALRTPGGLQLAIIDGHEIGCSYHRCCERCLQRRLQVGGKERIQYYHRLVALELIGAKLRLMVDCELVAPGEDEVSASLRLLTRVLKEHPRCFDVLSADAIYLRASVLGLLDAHGKYLVATLKENNADLLGDAKGLCGHEAAVVEQLPKKRLERWDLEGFRTDWYQKSLRVVRSLETTQERKRIARKWVDAQKITDWWWATTLPKALAPTARVAVLYGHGRWQIENEGFNELSNHWHADHYFHHHPVAITALWLILFAAHALFHSFWTGNLKSPAQKAKSKLHFARELAADLIGNDLRVAPS